VKYTYKSKYKKQDQIVPKTHIKLNQNPHSSKILLNSNKKNLNFPVQANSIIHQI